MIRRDHILALGSRLARASVWSAAALILLSVVAVVAACLTAWFEWRHTGRAADFRQGQQTGLGLLLATLDFSAVASFSTATPEDAATVYCIGYPARVVVTVVLVAALAGLVRSWGLSDSVRPKVLLVPIIGFTLLSGLVLLFWLGMAAGFNDVEYESVSADATVQLTRVLPQGPILLVLGAVLQLAAWRVIRAVHLREYPVRGRTRSLPAT